MPEAKTIDPLLVAQIVRSYVAHNSIPPSELPNLIATVHLSLIKLEAPAETPAREPAVAINRSHGRNFVACLECGWKGQMLRRHLTTSHGLSPDDYRARWKLKDAHPLTASGYSERRSTLAKQLGLGHLRLPAEAAPQPTASAPKPRGRPRNAPAMPAG
jgi:predicted transcriptional regulator